MIDIAGLVRERHAGETRVIVISNYGASVDKLLPRLNLLPRADLLMELTPENAVSLIEGCLWQDLAYSVELMPREAARGHAREFVNDFATGDARIYTNVKWESNGATSGYRGWNSMTGATFDVGVIVVRPDLAACFWVEDED